MTTDFSSKRFAFLMFPGFEELDLIGPWEIAALWHAYAHGPVCFTLSETGERLTCAKGLTVTPDHDFASAPDFDYLLVPGGFTALEERKRAPMLQFLRRSAATAEVVLSVCTGSLMLHAAGLLQDRRATTNWKFVREMHDYQGVTVVEERFVADGPVWTSAGVSAGTDMLLGFIAERAGEAVASVVQNQAEYYPDARLYGDCHRNAENPAYVRRLGAPTETRHHE